MVRRAPDVLDTLLYDSPQIVLVALFQELRAAAEAEHERHAMSDRMIVTLVVRTYAMSHMIS